MWHILISIIFYRTVRETQPEVQIKDLDDGIVFVQLILGIGIVLVPGVVFSNFYLSDPSYRKLVDTEASARTLKS